MRHPGPRSDRSQARGQAGGGVSARPGTDLRPHPDADLVPAIAADEHEALLLDIEQRGVEVPLDILMDGTVLDGRHRLMVARTLGIKEVPVRVIATDDPVGYMLRHALLRRHLTTAQKKALAARLIASDPERSDRQVSRIVGISRPTVARVRDDLIEVGEVAEVATSTGADGKRYPRSTAPESVVGPRERARAAARREFGATPVWMNHFTRWARRALPEQRKHLLHIKEEAESALALIDGDGSEARP